MNQLQHKADIFLKGEINSKTLDIWQKAMYICDIPAIQKDSAPEAADYEDVARTSCKVLEQLNLLLLKLDYDTYLSTEYNHLSAAEFLQLQDVIADSVLICLLYMDSQSYWSDGVTFETANNFLQTICRFLGISCVDEIFESSNVTNLCVNKVLLLILQKFSICFTKSNWKKRQPYVTVYLWMVKKFKNTTIGEHLPYLLPPALFMFDDYETEHKIKALVAIAQIIKETPAATLRCYGRAEVLFQALHMEQNSRESELLAKLFQPLINVAVIIDSDPNTSPLSPGKLETVFESLLRAMSHEQVLALRSVYASVLLYVLAMLNIKAIRWSKSLVEVVSNYLETYDGEDCNDRINILQSLRVFCMNCWPRIHIHAPSILKSLVRLVYDMHHKDNVVSQQAQKIILEESCKIVHMVRAIAPITCAEVCKGLNMTGYVLKPTPSCSHHRNKSNFIENPITLSKFATSDMINNFKEFNLSDLPPDIKHSLELLLEPILQPKVDL